MRKLALLLSLLALGALGLVACGGGGDDEATAASAAKNTDDGNPYDELAADPADNKSCGSTAGGRRLTVVEGDISCRDARRLMHRVAYNRLPYQWRCMGPEGATGGYEVCANLPGASSRIVIKVRFGREAADNKSWCPQFGQYRLRVDEGDISCRGARRVILDLANNRLPGSWSCTGHDADVVCTKEPGASSRIVITARFSSEAAAVEADPGTILSDESVIAWKANEWARLFATDALAACRYYAGRQPACERAACQRVGHPWPIMN